jgi:hypothetical protein
LDTTVYINSFVRRQTQNSGKTYTTLSFEEICKIAENQLEKGLYKKGYRDGVILISVPSENIHNFFCPYTKITDDTKLIAKLERRRPEEEPYIQIRALNGSPLQAGKVDLILYHYDVLKETNEQESHGTWELIAFHAIPKGIDKMPMGPITMMRNQLELPGGTKGNYNSNEWAESVNFWQKFAALQPNLDCS